MATEIITLGLSVLTQQNITNVLEVASWLATKSELAFTVGHITASSFLVVGACAVTVGIAAILLQMVLVRNGYEKTGKVVGGSGCAAAGALVGFSLGGPVLAGIGALAGLGVWTLGEFIQMAVDVCNNI